MSGLLTPMPPDDLLRGQLLEPMHNPFDELGPGLPGRRAAEHLQRELAAGRLADGVNCSVLEQPAGGKMFGVLVVECPDGSFGYLKAFSGMLAGRWDLPGFVPPLFDASARAEVEGPGAELVAEMTRRYDEAGLDPAFAHARAREDEARKKSDAELEFRREQNRQNRRTRKRTRYELGRDPRITDRAREQTLAELSQQSRADRAERRELERLHKLEAAAYRKEVAVFEQRAAALKRLRRIVCSRLMQRIHDTYRISNSLGEVRPLRSLYRTEPPSGAGDCAAPKLLGYAHRHGLTPLGLAEFWWGAPPPGGGRVSGSWYPACREKCRPLLPFMLEGIEVAAPRRFRPPKIDDPGLTIIYRDQRMIVVEKPAGLLSVQSSNDSIPDSVIARLRQLHPEQPLYPVHRLDMDTSGILVVCLDRDSHRNLQLQFERRRVRKRYLAWVDGVVAGDSGEIELALRADPNDRPRQIVDDTDGRSALSHWRVLRREPDRTLLEWRPHSGRTHQLRVHAAHPRGLGTAIVGDRLYGRQGPRLCLHAGSIEFFHPDDGRLIRFHSPTPF